MNLTPQELEARAKGYFHQFTDYTPAEEVVKIPRGEWLLLEGWCQSFLPAGIEVSGCVVWHGTETGPLIERAYCAGGETKFLQTTVDVDAKHLLSIVKKDYPDMVEFMNNRIAWWHLHPGYFGKPILSVGDVEECRKVQRESGFAENDCTFLLLLYGDRETGRITAGGFFVTLSKVYQAEVQICE